MREGSYCLYLPYFFQFCEHHFREINIWTFIKCLSHKFCNFVGIMVNIYTLYLGGSMFEHWARGLLSWLSFSQFSSVPTGKCWDKSLILATTTSKFFPVLHLEWCLIYRSPWLDPILNHLNSVLPFLLRATLRSPKLSYFLTKIGCTFVPPPIFNMMRHIFT